MATFSEEDSGQLGHMLEHVYNASSTEAMQDFGPRVHEGPPRRRNVTREGFPPRESTGRRSEATLVSHLVAHTGAINGIAVSPDQLFFVSGSDDKTVKVWDTSRLQRNVTSKPRTSYAHHQSRVTCVCIIEATHCFASAGEDGSIHIVRVHLTQSSSGVPKYSRLSRVREYHCDNMGEYVTTMIHYNAGACFCHHSFCGLALIVTAEATSNLLYATNTCNVYIQDIRSGRTALTMANPRHHGPISSLCLDKRRAWLVVGTLSGVLTLWDLRFGLLLRTWRAGSSLSPSVSVSVNRLALHPSKGNGLWIIVALGTGTNGTSSGAEFKPLIEVWDVEKGAMVETFATRDLLESGRPTSGPSPLTSVPQEVNLTPAAGIAALVRARTTSQHQGNTAASSNPFRTRWQAAPEDTPPVPSKDIVGLVVGSDFGGQNQSSARARPEGRSSSRGFLITGSEDKKLRFWDLARIEKSAVLSAPPSDDDRPMFGYV